MNKRGVTGFAVVMAILTIVSIVVLLFIVLGGSGLLSDLGTKLAELVRFGG